MHAWLPGFFSDAARQEVRGSEALHIARFTAGHEPRVKGFALDSLLNSRAYPRRK